VAEQMSLLLALRSLSGLTFPAGRGLGLSQAQRVPQSAQLA